MGTDSWVICLICEGLWVINGKKKGAFQVKEIAYKVRQHGQNKFKELNKD